MKENWYNPISLLKPGLQGVMNHITNGLSPQLKEAILNAKISFMFDDRPLPLRTPVADLVTNQIVIQDVHLAFLWCCSYATVAINSMYFDKMPFNEDIVTFKERPELLKVDLTLIWARSLITEVTWWPQDAARPDQSDHWTNAANNLFEASVAYLLFHEVGHLVLHSELKDLMATRRQDPYYETTDSERESIFHAEIEADAFALEALIGNSVLDDVLLIKYLGAALAQLSNFYLLDVPDTRGGKTHPDLDDRLRSVIQKAKFSREADEVQLHIQVSVGLQLFLSLTGKPFIPEEPLQMTFEHFESIENYLFDLIAQMKSAARQR